LFFCIALATLKPQAGIMAPAGGPTVPAQPVSYYIIFYLFFMFIGVLLFFCCTICDSVSKMFQFVM